ncbi:integral membrane protein [Paramyrothecium foliicola]|nr:integral membrane protein [Paramyrothecium foliicola]
MAGNDTQTNFNPDDNNSHLVYIPSAVFVVICPIMMALRVWARLRRGGSMSADDWTAIAALIFTLLTMGALVGSCQNGMGRHWAVLDKHERFEAMKYFFMAQVTYKAAINLIKCSLLLLYLKIFGNIPWFKWTTWSLLCIVASYCIGSVLVTIFQCRPIGRAFDKTVDGTCIDNSKFWYANAGFSIATDIIILLLPLQPVFKLQITLAQRLGLVAVFTLGIFVVITSCLRITTLDILAKTPDQTYNIANVMWTIIEPNVAVVCACLPILRPFIAKLVPMLRSKGSYPGNSYGHSGYAVKSRPTEGSQARDKYWVEIGGAQSDGIHMSRIQRTGSNAGSEESILGAKSPNKAPTDGNGSDGIQKTIEYSIEYTKKPAA